MKYLAVCGGTGDLEETQRFLEENWNIVYSTAGQLKKFMLLSKEYSDDPPLYFRNAVEYRQNARNIAFQNLFIALVLFALSIIVFISAIWLSETVFPVYAAGALLLLSLVLFYRLFLYFYRVHKNSTKYA